MSAEYFILKTLVKNGGSMSLAAFLNETRSKQSKYDSRYIRKNMCIRDRFFGQNRKPILNVKSSNGFVGQLLLALP